MNAKLTDRQKMFCKLIVNGTAQGESARQAGYSKDSADAQASRMLKDVKIIEYISFLKTSLEEIFAQEAKTMTGVLLEIANDKKSPTASRVRAATELLSRAGYVAPTKVEGTIKSNITGNVTTDSKETHIIQVIQNIVNENDDVADAILRAVATNRVAAALKEEDAEEENA